MSLSQALPGNSHGLKCNDTNSTNLSATASPEEGLQQEIRQMKTSSSYPA